MIRVKTATFPRSIEHTSRYIRVDRQSTVDYLRINRQAILNLILRGITYLTLGMAVNLVWTGGQSVIEFICIYVLPIYQDISNA